MKGHEIERLLPAVFRRGLRQGTPLFALLEVMEALHQPSEETLDRLEAFFAPRWAPEDFVPYLARWVDLERLLVDSRDTLAPNAPPSLPSGLGRLRELVASAAYLSKWRGTAKGLGHFLETATGVRGFLIEEEVLGKDGRPRPFHVRVRAPAQAEAYRALIERIIALEKPAYVTYELSFEPVSPESR